MERQERRTVPRTTLRERPVVWVPGLQEVRLLDLSPTGAQIEHLDLLYPNAPCHLDLPPPLGALTLPARVVWCAVIGRERRPGGDSRLVARSGLRFAALARAQHAVLTESLQQVATVLPSIGDGPRRPA
jgi:hypothetical protein